MLVCFALQSSCSISKSWHISRELQSDLLPAVDQVAPQWLGTLFATHVFTVLHHSSYSLVSPLLPPPRLAGSHTVRRQTRGTRDVVAWCRRTQDTAPLPRHLPVYSDSDSHLGDRSIHTTQDTRALSVWHMDPEHTKKTQHGSIVIFYFFLNHQLNKTDVSSDALWISIFVNLKKQKSEKAIQQNAEVSSALPCSCSDAAFADVATLISGPAAGPFHADKGRASLRRYSGLNGYISCLHKRGRHK